MFTVEIILLFVSVIMNKTSAVNVIWVCANITIKLCTYLQHKITNGKRIDDKMCTLIQRSLVAYDVYKIHISLL